MELPAYGYRRGGALVNRQRRQTGAPRVIAMRVYRVRISHAFLGASSPAIEQTSLGQGGCWA